MSLLKKTFVKRTLPVKQAIKPLAKPLIIIDISEDSESDSMDYDNASILIEYECTWI